MICPFWQPISWFLLAIHCRIWSICNHFWVILLVQKALLSAHPTRTRRQLLLQKLSVHWAFGDRSFVVSGPRVWNGLPVTLRWRWHHLDDNWKLTCFNLAARVIYRTHWDWLIDWLIEWKSTFSWKFVMWWIRNMLLQFVAANVYNCTMAVVWFSCLWVHIITRWILQLHVAISISIIDRILSKHLSTCTFTQTFWSICKRFSCWRYKMSHRLSTRAPKTQNSTRATARHFASSSPTVSRRTRKVVQLRNNCLNMSFWKKRRWRLVTAFKACLLLEITFSGFFLWIECRGVPKGLVWKGRFCLQNPTTVAFMEHLSLNSYLIGPKHVANSLYRGYIYAILKGHFFEQKKRNWFTWPGYALGIMAFCLAWWPASASIVHCPFVVHHTVSGSNI